MRFRILSLLVLAFSFPVAFAWADSTKPIPIKIGATLALSGKLAFIGEQERDGLLLAVEEINAKGGVNNRKLELILEDNLGETKSAVSGVNKLLNVDKVDVVFSAFTHITQAINNMIAKKNMTLLYASTVKSIAESNPRFFRDHFDANQSGKAIASKVRAAGHKKVTFITETNDACTEYENGFLNTIQSTDVSVLGREAFLPGESDFKATLLKMKARKPDAIICCTWRDTGIVLKQMNELGMIGIPTYHVIAPFLPSNDTPDFRALYEKNGLHSSWYGFVENTSHPEQRAFIDKFEKRFKRKPRPDSAFSYDDMFLLAESLKVCSDETSVDQDCVANWIKQSSFDGVAGRLEFSDSGLSNRKIPIISVKDGKWVTSENSKVEEL